MTDKEQKIKEIKVIIKSNPSLNSNETLKLVQSEGLGIRKQDFQKLFREQKQLPEPSKAKRKASIPKKFRKPEVITKDIEPIKAPKLKPITKEGQYGIMEVKITKDLSYWIKYTDKKDFKRQLSKLQKKYDLKRIKFVNHGFRTYLDFLDKEFESLLVSEGVEI